MCSFARIAFVLLSLPHIIEMLLGVLMRALVGTVCLALLMTPVWASTGLDLKSGKEMGYDAAWQQRYDNLLVKYAKQNCRSLKKVNKKATKTAGSGKKSDGMKALGGLLKQAGGVDLGTATQVSAEVVKDAEVRRDASQAVMDAKKCK